MEIFTAELEKENPKVHRKFLANLHQNDIEEERVLKTAFSKEKVRTERKLHIVQYKRQLNSLTSLDKETVNLIQENHHPKRRK